MALGLALSLLIGLALGLFGGGGSILAVPILTYVMGVPPKAAIAGSLLIVGITSAVAMVSQLRRGLVELRIGLTFGAAAMLGAYVSGTFARFLPDTWLLLGFGVMMVVTALAMLRGRAVRRPSEAAETGPLSSILLYGLGVGSVAGLLGAGGGFLIVPALVLLGGMPMRKAVATSLLVIALQSFAGFFGHLGHATVPWNVVLPATALATLGSLVGGRLIHQVRPEALRRGFAGLVLVVALFMVAHQLPHLGAASALYTAVFVSRWPWWVGGAAIAAVALGLLFVENRQLGVSTGCGELCRLPTSPAARASWRPSFLLGIVLGGALAALLAGHAPTLAMGELDQLPGGTLGKLGLLFGAGLMIGTGASLAGGCTSGHAIIGTALGARSSWLATAFFLVGGFATTSLVLLLRGGL